MFHGIQYPNIEKPCARKDIELAKKVVLDKHHSQRQSQNMDFGETKL